MFEPAAASGPGRAGDDPVAMTMTFAHELQHFVQCGTMRAVFEANEAFRALRLKSGDGFDSHELPIEKDAIGGPYFLSGLAEIEAQTGETNEAIGNLRQLLSIPAGLFVSIQRLRIDPVWDPIRNDPGFQQLLTGKELIGPNK